MYERNYSNISYLTSFVQYVIFNESGILIDKLKLPLSPGLRDVSEITPLLKIIVLPVINVESVKAGVVSFSHK